MIFHLEVRHRQIISRYIQKVYTISSLKSTRSLSDGNDTHSKKAEENEKDEKKKQYKKRGILKDLGEG